jgi:glycosyltransferase involved in cell wall biosynthesis
LRIVYTGTISYDRDPRPLLYAMHRLRSEGPATSRPVVMEFYGNCRWFNNQSLEQLARELGIGDSVIFHDWVPREVSKRAVDEADLLLLLAQRQPDQIPNKLYEYLGTRTPILAFVDPGSDSQQILEAVGGHHVETDPSSPESQARMCEVLRGEVRTVPRNDAMLQELTSESQMRRLAHLVGSLSQPGHEVYMADGVTGRE